ncbi:MFS transporter [soil metagenome]
MTPDLGAPDRHALLAVAVTFGINGAVLSSLLPRFPQIVANTGATEATFGAALAAIGVGGFVGSAIMPALAARLGLVRVVVGAGVLLALASVAIASAPSVALLAAAFALGGAADGTHDVSMNEIGLGEQSRRTGSVMGRLHGTWSLGATAGAALGALMAGLQVPVPVHIGVVAALAVITQLGVARWLRARPVTGVASAGETAAGPVAAAGEIVSDLPRRWPVLLLLAIVTLAAMAAEGVPLDWSALTLRLALDASPGVAGLGPVVFSAGVLLGRLGTDPAVDRYGAAGVVRGSCLLAATSMAVGLSTAAATDSPWPLLIALAVAGIGAASTFPLLFGAGDLVARRLRLPAGSGASIVGTLPRLGGLVLPITVGLLASALGLIAALGIMVVGALAVAALLPRLLRPI